MTAQEFADRLGVPYHDYSREIHRQLFRQWGAPNAYWQSSPFASAGSVYVDDDRDGVAVAVVGPVPWCTICERDVLSMSPEVGLIAAGVCVECWLDSVRDGVHAPEDIPARLRPLLPRQRGDGA